MFFRLYLMIYMIKNYVDSQSNNQTPNPKPETISNHQQLNFKTILRTLKIWTLNLFRILCFEFRVCLTY